MMRDKLIDLIKQGELNYFKNNRFVIWESIADNILANGGAVFPCNAGDTVYRVMTDERIKEPYKYKVMGIWHSAVETCSWVSLMRFVGGMLESSMKVPFSEFGKTIFLTKEEAEERQKELRDL